MSEETLILQQLSHVCRNLQDCRKPAIKLTMLTLQKLVLAECIGRFIFSYARELAVWCGDAKCVRAALSTPSRCLPPSLRLLENLVCIAKNDDDYVYGEATDLAHCHFFKHSFEIDTCAAFPVSCLKRYPSAHRFEYCYCSRACRPAWVESLAKQQQTLRVQGECIEEDGGTHVSNRGTGCKAHVGASFFMPYAGAIRKGQDEAGKQGMQL